MRVVESVLVGLALALAVAGGALIVLTSPWFTRVMVARLDVAATASLPPRTALELAEEVRSFSTRRTGGSLPAVVDGRAAFDSAAVSHLRDVRVVFVAARTVAFALFAVLLAWLVLSVVRHRFDRIAAALRGGSLWCLALPIVAGAVGAADFDWFFSAFHSVFFDAGTWTFPADSLLIQLFPERFWMSSAAVLAGLIALGGIALWFASVGARRATRRAASHTLQTGA